MTKEKLFLCLDQGSHASRAIIFDQNGAAICDAWRDIAITRSPQGHIEHDAEELIASVIATANEAVDKLGTRRTSLVAAGLATQRSSIACWDRETGKALSPVISWQDRRAAREVEKLSPHAKTIHETTGLFLTPHYGASKLRWCLEHLPEVRRALEDNRLCFGPLAGFILFRLLDERPHVIDPANGSRTQLYNLDRHDWDEKLLALFQVPRAPLPRCVQTLFDYGHLRLLPDSLRLPLTVCTGDQSAAIYAHGALDPDTATINIGTGAFISRPTGTQRVFSPRLLSSVILQTDAQTDYVLEGTVNGAASALEWAKETLDLDDLPQNLGRWLENGEHPPLFLNGVSGLGAPYWIPDFPSRFIGEGTKEAKAVAVAESILFLIAANLAEMEKSIVPPKALRVSGGLAALDGLCQKLADLTGIAVHRPGECEATARGIAFLLAGSPAHWPQAGQATRFTPRENPALGARYQVWLEAMPALDGIK